MHFGLVLLLSGFSMIGSIVFFAEYTNYSSCGNKLCKHIAIAMLIAFLSGAAWLFAASIQPMRIQKEFLVTPVKVVNLDGTYVQIISYTDQEGKQIMVNLNQTFTGVIPDGVPVQVTEYSKTGYLGISYEGMIVCSPTYKIGKR